MKKIVAVNYYWYDHCLIRDYPKLIKLIEDSINGHDYKTFKLLQRILNNFDDYSEDHISEFPELRSQHLVYLPNDVQIIYDDDTDEYPELTEELFKKITFSEYECG